VRVTPTQLFSAGAPGSCAGNGETVEEKMDDVRKDGWRDNFKNREWEI
jgi:hypothetical protein